MISEKELKKFKEIYKNRFGKDISDQEALKSATNLLNLMKLIYKPIPKHD
jgi:hypothetical protein